MHVHVDDGGLEGVAGDAVDGRLRPGPVEGLVLLDFTAGVGAAVASTTGVG